MGTWIYDSAHTGWNELHPVLLCQKLGTVDHSAVAAGNPWVSHPEFGDPARLAVVRDKLCALAKDGKKPDTTNTQKKPEHLWVFHPSVDGCQPGDAPPHGGNGDPIHLT
jgi:hypothetical protein